VYEMFKWFGWCLLFILLISLVLVSCDPITPPIVVEKPIDEGTYYFLAANNSDPFYVPGVQGFNDAGEMFGVKTEFVGPMDLNVNEQLKTFEELVASPKTRGIFWYPSDFAIGETIIKDAFQKGIPVVIGAVDSPYKGRKAFVGYNNVVLGTQAGAWAAELIDCKGSVGIIHIQSGPNLTERADGFESYIESTCPDVKILERATHDGSAVSEAATLEAYLIANPDLTLLWWADGAAGIQAQIWKEKQEAGLETLFLATDMPEATLQAVKDGVFVGSVGQDTYTEEFWGLMLLYYINQGYRVPDTLFLSAILVDKDNVDQYLAE